MMELSAKKLDTILVCPDDQPEFDGKTIQPAYQ